MLCLKKKFLKIKKFNHQIIKYRQTIEKKNFFLKMPKLVQIDFSPLPKSIPTQLSQKGKHVYETIKKNQPFGGITAKKIRAILIDSKKTDIDGNILFDENFSLQDLGDILYGELKTLGLCFKVGDRGGKWRLI